MYYLILIPIFFYIIYFFILTSRSNINSLNKSQTKNELNEKDINIIVTHWFEYKKLLLLNMTDLNKYNDIAIEEKKKKAIYFANKYNNDEYILNLKTTIKNIYIRQNNTEFTEATILLIQRNLLLKSSDKKLTTDWKFFKESGKWKVYQIGLLVD